MDILHGHFDFIYVWDCQFTHYPLYISFIIIPIMNGWCTSPGSLCYYGCYTKDEYRKKEHREPVCVH